MFLFLALGQEIREEEKKVAKVNWTPVVAFLNQGFADHYWYRIICIS